MKSRNGFVSNSSSCSFVVKMDGLEGKSLTVEDVKKLFPPSDNAKEVLSPNELEAVYVALWTLITANEVDNQYYGFYDMECPEFKWKKGRVSRCGQDSDADPYRLLNGNVSRDLFTYNSSLFDTKNIRFSGEY